ncbi:hypothetical protein B0H19DRAFT_1153739 [Mycena capillaripes]|nr:hypothetical protein B0H19DRAFT_1153739 [Mycena capillaripes]
MLSSLEQVPHDVLQHIALAGASPGSAPPLDLCCLLATCRTIYNGLNIHSTPHLYAAIFKLKYDSIVCHTDSSLASELVQRCRALRRCRHLDMSFPGLRQDLWTLLWMIIEEGRCVPINEARFPEFIIELARYYLREDVQPRGDLKNLIIWLLCLGVSRQDILSQNPEIRNTLVALLRPFVSTFASRVPPFTSLHPSSTVIFRPASQDWPVMPLAHLHVGYQEPEGEVLMRYNVQMCSPYLPPASDAAIILIFALKEAVPLQIPYHVPATRAIAAAENRVGPTAEDYTAFQQAVTLLFSDIRPTVIAHPSATTLKFLELDPWISEILAVPDRYSKRVRPAYLAGSLTGVWEGSMMVSRVTLAEFGNETLSSDYLCRTPMQCEFSEYYCFPPCTPQLELGEHTIPSGFEYSSENAASYQKFTPGKDFQHDFPCPILDHILIGQTLRDHEDAWGSSGFDFAGRVHDDGLIAFTRRPKNDESESPETWIFEGRLHYGTAFVGTFRSSFDESCGVHGIFSMSKRTTASMQ